MSYRIALNFEDGATRFIDCRPGEKVLDAAYRQKVNLPMDCSDGVCGTCKCRCESGEYDLGEDYVEDALTEDEARGGMVLTCQMVVQSDCVIEVPVPSSACKITPTRHRGRISAVELVSDSTIILRLDLERPSELAFLPGQYVNLAIPGTSEHRAYSFSSKPGAAEASFLIRNVPSGRMSGWLSSDAAPGQEMEFVGPSGSFFLRPMERPVLLLGGGTGLAPLLSMLEVMADAPPAHPVRLVYGVTRDSDIVELSRLDAIASRLPDFSYCITVADPQSGQPLKGYVTDHLSDADLRAGDVDIYLCGPPPMVEAVRRFLADKGVAPAHFHYEKFASAELTAA